MREEKGRRGGGGEEKGEGMKEYAKWSRRHQSPNIKLERLKAASYSMAARTFPPCALFAHEDVNASLAETAYAFRTCV